MNDDLTLKYVNLMRECSTGDTEIDHGNADDLLCSLLTELGFGDVVNEYGKIDKWYA